MISLVLLVLTGLPGKIGVKGLEILTTYSTICLAVLFQDLEVSADLEVLAERSKGQEPYAEETSALVSNSLLKRLPLGARKKSPLSATKNVQSAKAREQKTQVT